jgi:hypothetical protein
MADISNVIGQLVACGWPRDYANVLPPCWYAYGSDGSLSEPLEDPDYAPSLEGQEATLVIAPPTVYFLFVKVAPNGELGATTVEVHDGQGPSADGTAGVIPVWLGLDEVLAQARLIYLRWEVQELMRAQADEGQPPQWRAA